MEPAIALKYTSRSGNGLLGTGWHLDGISEIHPCAKTFAQEGSADGIDFDGDNHCLDGHKIVTLGTAAGVTEYRTEQESFSRIVAHASAAGPTMFVVYEKDGRILEYAPITARREDRTLLAEDSIQEAVVTSVTLAWLLSKERDRAGNEMRYEYQVTLEDRSPYAIEYHPSAIEYTLQGNTGAIGKRKVVFAYETRPDPTFAYVSGVKLQTTKRLRAIEMFGPNPVTTEPLWSYALSYQTGPTAGRSLLASIKKCGALGGCLLAKQFHYGNSREPFFRRAYEQTYQTAEASPDAVHLVFDMDGDGKDELLFEGEKGQRYFRKTSSGALDGAPLAMRLKAGGDESFAKMSLATSTPVDIDADGIVELAGLIPGEHVRLFRWSTGTKEFQSIWEPIPAIRASARQRLGGEPPSHFIDLNGDALPDLVKVDDAMVDSRRVDYARKWTYWLNRGNSFGLPVPIAGALQSLPCQTRVQSASTGVDLRGDHRGTLVVGAMITVRNTESHCPDLKAIGLDDSGSPALRDLPLKQVPGERRVFADLNGDSLRDWVGVRKGGGLQVWWNTGLGFRENNGDLWPVAGDVEGDWHVADMDADGDDDLWVMKGGEQPALVIFRYVPNRVPVGNASANMTKTVNEGIPPGYLGDFNGDGALDVASRKDKTFQVHLQDEATRDLVVGISDENSDLREKIAYLPAERLPRAAQAACRYPQRCIRQGIDVVREHARVGAGRHFYAYEDPRADLRGRGFLGFGKVRVWDAYRGTETTTTYDHTTRDHEIYPYALLPTEVLVVMPIVEQAAPGQPFQQPKRAPARLVKRVNVYATKWLHEDRRGGFQTRPYFVHPESWTTWEWEQDVDIDWNERTVTHIPAPTTPPARVLRKRDGSFQFDDYGNVVEEKVATDGGVARSIVSAYEIRDDDWLVGLVRRREATEGPSRRIVEYDHDDRALLTQVRIEPDHPDPDIPETMTITRSPDDGLVSAMTRQAAGQAPRTMSIDYDEERVFPRRVWNELGHAIHFTYHPGYGTLGSVMDANAVRTRRIHDDLGRLRGVLPDGGAKVTFDYDLSKISVRDETGAEGFVHLDAWDRPVAEVRRGFDGEWVYRTTDFDWFGNVAMETRPAPDIPIHATPRTAYRWDSLGRLVEVQLPDGARIRHKHSFSDTTSWDAENHKSYIVRDLDGRIARSVQVLGSAELPTTYRYREFDLIESIADPKGNLIELDYDQRGRRTRLRDPDTGTTTTSYNGYGELRQKVDARSQVTQYERDVIGRIFKISDADGVTELFWDASSHGIGKLSVTTSPDGTRRKYHYDPFGRPERLDWMVDGETFSADMAYDALGRLSTLAYPEVPGQPRLKVGQTYNAAGYLAELADISSPAVKSLWRVDGRNLDDALTRATYGNGLVTERSYDDVTGRLKELNGGAIYALAYSYDANGLVKSRADSVKARGERFLYDSLHRLRHWYLERTDGARNTEFDYDELGNLTKLLVNGRTTEENQYGGPGAGPHALTASRVHGSFTYDARGRRTDGRGQHIEYTEIDLPKAITTPAGATTFGYDASGTRVKKAGPSGTTISIGDLYERRTDPQGGRKHVFYIQGSEGVIAQRVVDEGAGTSATQYVLTDALGSVGVATDESGKEIERYYFDPFGQRIDDPGRALRTSPLDVRIGYTGHRHDDELGLIDMRGRMYDPATRRFLTPDPIVPLPLFGQSYNGYSYALNSPINLVDPTGFDPWWGPVSPDGGSRFGLLPGWFRFHFHYSSGAKPSGAAGDEYGRQPRDGGGGYFSGGGYHGGGGGYRGGGGSSRTRSGPPKPSPAPTDSHGRELPSTSSPGAAGPTTGFTLASYQDDSAGQSGGAEAEQARIDAFNEKLGMVSGILGSILYATPAGPVLLALSGVTGLYEIKRGIETGDPGRVGWGAVGSIPMLGSISRAGRLGAGLGAARGGQKFPGTDPSKTPPGFEWRGKPGSAPGSKEGNFYNPKTGESFRPDLNHPDPVGPHWDYRDPGGKWWRIKPDGTMEPK
jgi:RHS repeat-associated protein